MISPLTARICRTDDQLLDNVTPIARPMSWQRLNDACNTIRNPAGEQQARWCIIGGAGVMLHLMRIGLASAAARASMDLDLAADRPLEMPKANRFGPLLLGGWRYRIEGQTFDWIVRKTDHQYALYQRMIAAATELYPGLPVPPAACLVATKALLPSSAFRPKDHVDCQLLLGTGAATIESTTIFLERTIAKGPYLSDALRRLRCLAIPPTVRQHEQRLSA